MYPFTAFRFFLINICQANISFKQILNSWEGMVYDRIDWLYDGFLKLKIPIIFNYYAVILSNSLSEALDFLWSLKTQGILKVFYDWEFYSSDILFSAMNVS